MEIQLKQISSVLSKIECSETINVSNLKKILKNKLYDVSEEWNEKIQITKILQNVKNGIQKVSYQKVKGMNYGRFQPSENSLCRVRREIKCTITKNNNKDDLYIDIDISNCHFNILYQICKKNKIKCEAIKKYIKHRKEYIDILIKDYEITKKQAKTLFIAILYGASFNKWLLDNKITRKSTINKYIEELHKEVSDISKIIVLNNNDIVNEVKKNKILKQDKYYNLESSVLSTYLQEYESRILENMYIKLLELELIVKNDCILCYDGIMILKKNFDKLYKLNYIKNIEEVLKSVEQHIKETTSFDLTLETKDFNDVIELKEYEEDEEDEENEENEKPDFFDILIEFEKNHFKVRNPISYSEINIEGKLILRSSSDFKEVYKNKYYYQERIECDDNDDREKKNKKKRYNVNNFVQTWLGYQKIRTYEKIDFLPRLQTPDYIYNEFTKYKAEELEPSTLNFEDSLIYKHLINLCNEDMNVVKYCLLWLSRRIRQPTKPSNTSLLFKSKEGAGKNLFLDYIGNNILGSDYYLCTPKMDDIFGNFNASIYKKIIVVLNEISYNDSKMYTEKLKDGITAQKITINDKNEKKREITNTTGFIIFTNNDIPIKIEPTDRRFVSIESSDKYACDVEYFTKLVEEMESKKYDRAFYDYLNNMKESDYFDFTGKRPETEYNEILKEVHIPAQSKFLEEYYYNNEKEEEREIYSSDLFNEFCAYLESNKINIEVSSTSFGLYLRKFKSITKYRAGKGFKYLINIQELKTELMKMKHMKEQEIQKPKKIFKL